MAEKTLLLKPCSVDEWKTRERELAGDFEQVSRHRVEVAWRWGEAIYNLREGLEHGDFLDYLHARGIAKSTAYRAIELFSAFPQISQIGKFATLTEARKAIPKPQKETGIEGAEEALPKLTAAEKRLMERDALVEQAKQAEERAGEAEQKVKEQAAIIEHYENGEKVSEGFQQGRSVIENKQAEVSQLKKKIGDLQRDLKEAKRENSFLKRKLKEKDKQIEALKEGEI